MNYFQSSNIKSLIKSASLFYKLAHIPELDELNKNNNKAYEIFGLDKGCGSEQVKARYKELVLQYHPDKAKSSEESSFFTKKLIVINRAFDILKKKERGIKEEAEAEGVGLEGKDPVESYLDRFESDLIDTTNYRDWEEEVELDFNYDYQNIINSILIEHNIKPNSPEAEKFIKNNITKGMLERQRLRNMEKSHPYGVVSNIKGNRYTKTKVITLQKLFNELNFDQVIASVRKVQQEILRIKKFTHTFASGDVPFGDLIYKLYYNKFDEFPIKFIKKSLDDIDSANELIYGKDEGAISENNATDAAFNLKFYLEQPSNRLYNFPNIIKDFLELVNGIEEDTGHSFNELKNSINELKKSFDDFVNRYNKFYEYMFICKRKDFIGILSQ